MPDYQVVFDLPPDFHDLAIGADPDEVRTALVHRIGAERVEDIPAFVLKGLLTDYEQSSRLMRELGIFHASTALGRVRDHPSASSLFLAHTEADCTDPEVAVEGVLRIRGRGPGSENRKVQRYDLPCGPAAITVEAAPGMVIPAELTESGEDEPVTVATLQAWIPVPAAADPARRSLLVVTFTTPSVQDWEVYCPVVVDLLRSLRFVTDGHGGGDGGGTGGYGGGQGGPAVPAPAGDGASRIAAAFG
ncbi:hypothetical protein [Streptomyces sp. NPDC001380]|uniref:hypothetical protein n=1 Tax=Streptomyces sp. NPDC001380 TaxID=3364566 RepID=UPI003693615D